MPELSKRLPDCVVPVSPGEVGAYWVYSVAPKLQWRPRVKGSQTRTEHPGSAIQYEGRIYEVMSAEEIVQRGYNVRYNLQAWDSANIIRSQVTYTPGADTAAEASHHDELEKGRLRTKILWLFPLAGLAPGAMQQKWGELAGLEMAWVSAASAIVLLAAAALTLRFVTHGFLYDVMAYLAGESIFRLLFIVLFQRPRGSPILAFPYNLWRLTTHAKSHKNV